jgi:hypothetical protein
MFVSWASDVTGTLSLGYRPEGGGGNDESHVGRLRRRLNSWESHYDPKGLLRHGPVGLSGRPPDDARWRLDGPWPAASQARQAVDRRRDELSSTERAG